MARGMDEAEQADQQLQAMAGPDPDQDAAVQDFWEEGHGDARVKCRSSLQLGGVSTAGGGARGWADFCDEDGLDAGNVEDQLAQVWPQCGGCESCHSHELNVGDNGAQHLRLELLTAQRLCFPFITGGWLHHVPR